MAYPRALLKCGLRFAGALGVVASFACPLAAQQPPAADQPAPAGAESGASVPAPTATPPDVVLLKNGGMARGTIVEVDPNGSVSLQLGTGTTRTWPMTDVKYAGPAAQMPSATASSDAAAKPESASARASGSAPSSTAQKAHLRLSSRQADATFYIEGESSLGEAVAVDGFTRLCTAPCEVELPVGEYNFAVSSGGSPPRRYSKPLRVEGSMELDGSHTSHKGYRTGGWVTFAAGMATSTVLFALARSTDPEVTCTATSYSASCNDDTSKRDHDYVASLVSGLVGLVGLPIALKKDTVKVNVVLGAQESTATAPLIDAGTWMSALSGLGVRGAF